VLQQCWEAINCAQRALGTLRAAERAHGVGVDNVELVPPVLRTFHARRAEMASFVTSLQYYIVFEVLEPAWGKLTAALPAAADLDAIIALHEGTLQVGCAGRAALCRTGAQNGALLRSAALPAGPARPMPP
jgi:hypothetical protein